MTSKANSAKLWSFIMILLLVALRSFPRMDRIHSAKMFYSVMVVFFCAWWASDDVLTCLT